MIPSEMRRDAEAIRCRWIPFSVQQAALVTATRAIPLMTLVLAMREMRKQSPCPKVGATMMNWDNNYEPTHFN